MAEDQEASCEVEPSHSWVCRQTGTTFEAHNVFMCFNTTNLFQHDKAPVNKVYEDVVYVLRLV